MRKSFVKKIVATGMSVSLIGAIVAGTAQASLWSWGRIVKAPSNSGVKTNVAVTAGTPAYVSALNNVVTELSVPSTPAVSVESEFNKENLWKINPWVVNSRNDVVSNLTIDSDFAGLEFTLNQGEAAETINTKVKGIDFDLHASTSRKGALKLGGLFDTNPMLIKYVANTKKTTDKAVKLEKIVGESLRIGPNNEIYHADGTIANAKVDPGDYDSNVTFVTTWTSGNVNFSLCGTFVASLYGNEYQNEVKRNGKVATLAEIKAQCPKMIDILTEVTNAIIKVTGVPNNADISNNELVWTEEGDKQFVPNNVVPNIIIKDEDVVVIDSATKSESSKKDEVVKSSAKSTKTSLLSGGLLTKLLRVFW